MAWFWLCIARYFRTGYSRNLEDKLENEPAKVRYGTQ